MYETTTENNESHELHLEDHVREKLLQDNQIDEFQRGFTQSELCRDIFRPESKYLSLMERVNYKKFPLKVHKFLLSLKSPINFREEFYAAYNNAISQQAKNATLDFDDLDFIDWDIPF